MDPGHAFSTSPRVTLPSATLRHEATGQGDSWASLCSCASCCLSLPTCKTKNSLTLPDVLFKGIWLRGSIAFAKDYSSGKQLVTSAGTNVSSQGLGTNRLGVEGVEG